MMGVKALIFNSNKGILKIHRNLIQCYILAVGVFANQGLDGLPIGIQ